jgi:hypothetical protein
MSNEIIIQQNLSWVVVDGGGAISNTELLTTPLSPAELKTILAEDSNRPIENQEATKSYLEAIIAKIEAKKQNVSILLIGTDGEVITARNVFANMANVQYFSRPNGSINTRTKWTQITRLAKDIRHSYDMNNNSFFDEQAGMKLEPQVTLYTDRSGWWAYQALNFREREKLNITIKSVPRPVTGPENIGFKGTVLRTVKYLFLSF